MRHFCLLVILTTTNVIAASTNVPPITQEELVHRTQ